MTQEKETQKNEAGKLVKQIPYLESHLFCKRCKYMWIPRTRQYPKQCPRCGSKKYRED